MSVLFIDAIHMRRWFVATVIGADGFPTVFCRDPAYPLCGVDDLPRHLDGATVYAFEDAREAIEAELPDAELPGFTLRGPRPPGTASTVIEGRWLTGRNARSLATWATRLIEELGL